VALLCLLHCQHKLTVRRYAYALLLVLPRSLMQLVYEKEKRLRMMMKMHGLGDMAYWLVMYSWFWMLYVTYMLIFVVFGSIIKLNMFTRNNYGERAPHLSLLLFCVHETAVGVCT
jgi:hypothetical protein